MTSRALAPLAVAALSGAVVLSASAGPPAGHPSAKRHCRSGRIAVRGTAGARRLTVGGKRAPIIACVKPLPTRPEGGYRAVERLLDSPSLVDPRLRRAEHALRAHNRKLGRALRRGTGWPTERPWMRTPTRRRSRARRAEP